MANGALTVAQFPGEMIEVVCAACERRGVYAKARLAEQFGAAMALPTLLSKLTHDYRERTRPPKMRCGLSYARRGLPRFTGRRRLTLGPLYPPLQE